MCRLFGFRSVLKSGVHESLLHADNALQRQSKKHSDGWGVSYYVLGVPHVIKSCKSAIEDNLFNTISGVVSSNTVLAHLRRATMGNVNILNTHPFQYGNWVFAHNGDIKDFEKVRPMLLQEIDPNLRHFVLGNTDSEAIFYYLLTHVAKHFDLGSSDIKVYELSEVIRKALHALMQIIGEHALEDKQDRNTTYLTFIITNGSNMLAYQGGKQLYYSVYKRRCKERATCAYFSDECESMTKTGKINHLLFSSEHLGGENVWIAMSPGQMIGVDAKMQFRVFT